MLNMLMLCTNGAKAANNQWFGGWVNFHSPHSLVGSTKNSGSNFPTFYHYFTHTFTQPVHKISPTITVVGGRFSAEYTGPITTTTTFKYKKIEKEAA